MKTHDWASLAAREYSATVAGQSDETERKFAEICRRQLAATESADMATIRAVYSPYQGQNHAANAVMIVLNENARLSAALKAKFHAAPPAYSNPHAK